MLNTLLQMKIMLNTHLQMIANHSDHTLAIRITRTSKASEISEQELIGHETREITELILTQNWKST